MKAAAVLLIAGLAVPRASAAEATHPHVLSVRIDFAAFTFEFSTEQFREDEKPAKPSLRRSWQIDAPREIMRLKNEKGRVETRFFDEPDEAEKVESGVRAMREAWGLALRPCFERAEVVFVATLWPFEDLIDLIMESGTRAEVRSGALLWRDRPPCDLKDAEGFYSHAAAAAQYATISVLWWDAGRGRRAQNIAEVR